ncbi:hypothetical protein [Synechococcus sp. A15-60]|uniref:hypothetical protein n=1 Tax=Synechococcus sp. A15-60 TaxID=1050655 RepID=UPI002106D451|nr:hypothetical protein [Synechococcus sp. A15-60]
MSRRQYSERAALEGRSRREVTDQRYRSRRFDDRGRYASREPRRADSTRFQSELERDFAAMQRVWQMLRHGAVRMLGEVGRQY